MRLFPQVLLKSWKNLGNEYLQVFRDLPPDNIYFTLLVRSLITEIKRRVPNRGTVLELGCGEGYLSRKLYYLGFHITACDISPELIQWNKQYQRDNRLTYSVCDVTHDKTVPKMTVDLIVLNMVIMYLKTIKSVPLTLLRRLQPGGYLIMSLPHPCFFLKESHTWFENVQSSLNIFDYFQSNSFPITFGKRIVATHYHKTLEHYLNCFIQAGFTLVSIKEVRGKVGKSSRIPYYLLITFQQQTK